MPIRLRFSEQNARKPFVLSTEELEVHISREEVSKLIDDCMLALWMEKNGTESKRITRSG